MPSTGPSGQGESLESDTTNSCVIEPPLGRRTARASAIVVFGQLLSIGVRFVAIGFLARLLTPEDFGAAALVMFIASSFSQIRMAGLQQFLVRSERLTALIEGTANTLNLTFGLAASAVMLLLIAWQSDLLESNHNMGSTFQLSAIFVFLVGLDALPKARLMREMRFARLAIVEFICRTTLPYLGAIVVACFWHRGPETALLPYLLAVVLAPAALFVLDRRIPFCFSYKIARKILRFGLPLGIATLLSMLLTRCELLFIGKFSTMENLGYYVMAMQLVRVPGYQLIYMLSGVLTSAFSRLRQQERRLRDAYLKSLYIFMMVSGTALVVLATSSQETVVLILGPKFAPCGILVKILASGFFVRFPSYYVGPLLTALGRTRTLAVVNASVGVVQVIVFGAAAMYGLNAVCFSVIGMGLLSSIVWIVVLRGVIRIPVRAMLLTLGRIILVMAVAYAGAGLVSEWLPAGGENAMQLLRIGMRAAVVLILTAVLMPLLVPDLIQMVRNLVFGGTVPKT